MFFGVSFTNLRMLHLSMKNSKKYRNIIKILLLKDYDKKIAAGMGPIRKNPTSRSKLV